LVCSGAMAAEVCYSDRMGLHTVRDEMERRRCADALIQASGGAAEGR
jgi:hypothetical protein